MTPFLILAALLAAGAAYTVWLTRRTAAAHPPTGRFVSVDGLLLHLIDTGPGDPALPPIVLLHGASGNARDQAEGLMPALAARGHRVVAIDRPGHGHSDRPGTGWPDPSVQARLMRGAWEAAGIERPIVLGHSWSGALVVELGIDHAEAVAGLIVLSGASHPWWGGVAWYNHVPPLPVLGPLFLRAVVAPIGRLRMRGGLKSVFAPQPVPDDYARRIGATMILHPDRFRANAEDMANLNAYFEAGKDRYDRIHVPLLIVTGDVDTVVGPGIHSVPLSTAARDARLHLLPGVGHMPHHTAKDRVVELIEGFVAEIAA